MLKIKMAINCKKMHSARKNHIYLLVVLFAILTGCTDKIFVAKGRQQENLSSAENFCIMADTLFVHDRFTGIKVFDLDGTFIQIYSLDRPRNKGIFKPHGQYFIGNECVLERANFSQSTWYLTKYKRDFEPVKEIARVETDFFHTPQFEPAYILCFDSDGNTYFPTSRDEYRILKFDSNGDKVFTFGRKYIPETYSEKTKIIYNSVFGKKIAERRMPALATYPPIVRYLFVDDFDYIWVVAGEWNLETGVSSSTNTTIDIFNNKGEFLYSFVTNLFGYRSLVKNRRLYSAPTSERRSIDVYSISLPLTEYK